MASRLLATARKHAAASSFHTLRRTATTIQPAIRLAATATLQRAPLACRCFATEAAAAETKPAESAEATPAASAEVAKLQAEHAKVVAEKDAAIKEANEKYMRALAEAQNTLTRSMTQIADAKKFAVQSFAKQLLEMADVLEIANKAAEDQAKVSTDPAFKNLHEGMTMTQKMLLQIFERNGLKKFEPLGEKFDPYFHDGLLQVEDPTKTPGTVAMVLKSGYKLHERCLRAAQVGTVKAPAAPQQ